MIDHRVLESTKELASRFQAAQPFKHVLIDNFFELSAAERLLEDFPKFDRRNAVNEHGAVGGKAVVTTLKSISPFYHSVMTTYCPPRFSTLFPP